jgi:hypothetical protein
MATAAPNSSSSTAAVGEDVCAVCGRTVDGAAFCHIYQEGRRITLCSPACAEVLLHRSESSSKGNAFADADSSWR